MGACFSRRSKRSKSTPSFSVAAAKKPLKEASDASRLNPHTSESGETDHVDKGDIACKQQLAHQAELPQLLIDPYSISPQSTGNEEPQIDVDHPTSWSAQGSGGGEPQTEVDPVSVPFPPKENEETSSRQPSDDMEPIRFKSTDDTEMGIDVARHSSSSTAGVTDDGHIQIAEADSQIETPSIVEECESETEPIRSAETGATDNEEPRLDTDLHHHVFPAVKEAYCRPFTAEEAETRCFAEPKGEEQHTDAKPTEEEQHHTTDAKPTEEEHHTDDAEQPTQEKHHTGDAEQPTEEDAEQPTQEKNHTGDAEQSTEEELRTGDAEQPTEEEFYITDDAEQPREEEVHTDDAEQPREEEVHTDEPQQPIIDAVDQIIDPAILPLEKDGAVERQKPGLKRSWTCDEPSAVSENKRLFRLGSLQETWRTPDDEETPDHSAPDYGNISHPDYYGLTTSERSQFVHPPTTPQPSIEADPDSHGHSSVQICTSAAFDKQAANLQGAGGQQIEYMKWTTRPAECRTADADSSQQLDSSLLGRLLPENSDQPSLEVCSSESLKTDVASSQKLAMESSSTLAAKFFELKKQYLSSCSAESSRAAGLQNNSYHFRMLVADPFSANHDEASTDLSAHSRATSMDSTDQHDLAMGSILGSSFRREHRFVSMRSISSLDEEDSAGGKFTSDSETFEFYVSFRSSSSRYANGADVPRRRTKKNRPLQMWKKPTSRDRRGIKEEGRKMMMRRQKRRDENAEIAMELDPIFSAGSRSGRFLNQIQAKKQCRVGDGERGGSMRIEPNGEYFCLEREEMQNEVGDRALWSILRSDTSRSFIASDATSETSLDLRALRSTASTTPCTTPMLSADSSPRRIKQICPLALTPEEIAEIWVAHHLKPIDYFF